MSRLIRPTPLRLPNNEVERHATWLELFFDLIFVVIITELAARLSNQLTYFGIFQFGVLFVPVMWTWASYTVFAARFDNNDIIHWMMTFVIMFAGVIMAIQIPTALESGAFAFTIGFLIAQLSILLLYVRVFYDHSTPRSIIIFYLLGFGSGGVFWALSLLFDNSIKFVFWSLGMFIYLLIPWIGRKRILSKAPLDSVYIPERFGLFTIIIMGQTIASVVIGLKYANWNPTSIYTSVMAFILAVLIWVQYYRFIQIADYKCTLQSGQPYIYTHIPLIIALILIGVCTESFIETPIKINNLVNIVFCFSTILYLISFYFLQYLTLHKFEIRGISLGVGVFAILLLFLVYPMQPANTLTGLVIIFMMLFMVQFLAGNMLQHQ